METISAEVKLENAVDRGEVERGDRKESDIRRASVHASVDTTGVRPTLPRELVERLGLGEPGALAGPVTVRLGDRKTSTDCVVGSPPAGDRLHRAGDDGPGRRRGDRHPPRDGTSRARQP